MIAKFPTVNHCVAILKVIILENIFHPCCEINFIHISDALFLKHFLQFLVYLMFVGTIKCQLAYLFQNCQIKRSRLFDIYLW